MTSSLSNGQGYFNINIVYVLSMPPNECPHSEKKKQRGGISEGVDN